MVDLARGTVASTMTGPARAIPACMMTGLGQVMEACTATTGLAQAIGVCMMRVGLGRAMGAIEGSSGAFECGIVFLRHHSPLDCSVLLDRLVGNTSTTQIAPFQVLPFM